MMTPVILMTCIMTVVVALPDHYFYKVDIDQNELQDTENVKAKKFPCAGITKQRGDFRNVCIVDS